MSKRPQLHFIVNAAPRDVMMASAVIGASVLDDDEHLGKIVKTEMRDGKRWLLLRPLVPGAKDPYVGEVTVVSEYRDQFIIEYENTTANT